MRRTLSLILVLLFVAPGALARPADRHGPAASIDTRPLRAYDITTGEPVPADDLTDPISTAEDADAASAWVVALHGPTALELYRAGGGVVGDTSGKARRALDEIYARVAASQLPSRMALQRAGARIIGTYDTAYNGFLVVASARQLAEVSRAPGVRLVYRAPEWRVALDHAVPLVGGDKARSPLGYTGKGVRVAIIDTGIDYFHRSLGGEGKAKDFTDDNPDVAESDTFPTDKVIGGYDFAGTNYGTGGPPNQPELLVPKPDMDPRDQSGHGSHVSGIAAGVTGAPGLYPGIAPAAELIALKVFGGIGGGTNLVNDAIEWTVKANLNRTMKGYCRRDARNLCRIDVINMSLGSIFAVRLDEAARFVRSASEAGVVVVAASGNDGDVAFITGSPGGAPESLTVANTLPSGEMGDKIEAIFDGQTHEYEALEGAESLSRQLAEHQNVRGPLADVGRGCPGDTVAMLAGKVGLVDAQGCAFTSKLQALKAAGAIAGIVYSPDDRLLRMAGVGSAVDIPSFWIRATDGADLKAALGAGKPVDVRLSADFRGSLELVHLIDTVADSSSRGPSRGGAYKPEISAPGTNIRAPRMGSGRETLVQSGTSMAAPLVAGGAALVVERLRKEGLAPADAPLGGSGLGPLDVQAMLVGHATAPTWLVDDRLNRPSPLALGGVGRMRVDRALVATTLVRAGAFATIDFGYQAVSEDLAAVGPGTVRNLSAEARRFAVEARVRMEDDRDHGVTFAPSATTIDLPASGSTTLDVTAAVDPSRLKPYTVYGGDRLQSGATGAMADAEVDGVLTLRQVDAAGQPVAQGEELNVPIYMLPRAASRVSAGRPVAVDATTRRGEVRLANPGEGAGRTEAFVLLGTDAAEGNIDGRIDIDMAGARLVAGRGGQRLVEFAVHTTGRRTIPLEGQVQVWIDSDRDGDLDWMIYNADRGTLTSRSFNGQMVSVARDVVSNNPLTLGRQAIMATADVDIYSRTVIVRSDAARLGLTGTAVRFNAVVVLAPGFEDVRGDPALRRGYDSLPDDGWTASGVPSAGRVAFDESTSAVPAAWTALVPATGQSTLGVTSPAAGAQPKSLLLVYPDNAPGDGDAEVIDIGAGAGPTPTSPRTPSATPARGSATPAPTRTPGGAPPVLLPVALKLADWG